MHTVNRYAFKTTNNIPKIETIKASANPILTTSTTTATTAARTVNRKTKSTSTIIVEIVFGVVNEIMPLAKMARLWWYCATILLWWLVLVTPIHAAAMVDPLKIFWVLTNSSYLGMFTYCLFIQLYLCGFRLARRIFLRSFFQDNKEF